jgi:NAD(P)-dependent dehydrogenase (short-subunit alcohol dehydrogenase family)
MGVLVTGGTGALGTAVVKELLDSGYGCAVTWIVERERERAESEFGDRAVLIEADLSDGEAAARAVNEVDDLEAVVNLVGGFASGPLVHETDPEDFFRMHSLNLAPAFHLAHAAMPRLLERGEGAFIGVSAQAALKPFPGAAGYTSAKAAVLTFIKALDAEYGPKGIRCNAILPGVIDTPANREAMPDADTSKWVEPQAIARVVRFLVSTESAPVRGASIPV